jgi:hypothetical protein
MKDIAAAAAAGLRFSTFWFKYAWALSPAESRGNLQTVWGFTFQTEIPAVFVHTCLQWECHEHVPHTALVASSETLSVTVLNLCCFPNAQQVTLA